MKRGGFTVKRIDQERNTQFRQIPIEADEIRARAYQIYERRGGANGSELEDWLQAEAEIKDERTVNSQRIQRVA
jgi:Protein of unknown function (DUF2934)